MENVTTSPLQLYKKAYSFHYEENNLREARNLYRELIKNYPGSDIADYAQIQLSELSRSQEEKAQSTTDKNHPAINRIIIVLLITSFLCIAGIVSYLIYSSFIVKGNLEAIYKISQVYPKLYTGNDADAFRILNEIKAMNKGDITPYAIAADVYLKGNNFAKARNEFESFQNLYPDNATTITDYVNGIAQAEKTYIDSLKQIAILKNIVEQEKNETLKGKNETSKNEVKRIETKRYSGNEDEPEIIEQNSVTYF